MQTKTDRKRQSDDDWDKKGRKGKNQMKTKKNNPDILRGKREEITTVK